MPLQHGGEAAVQANIHELAHHGTRRRSHEQIVAIALHTAHPHGGSTANYNDDHHASHNIANAHPHQSHSERHTSLDKPEVNPHAKTFHVETGVVSGTPHGQYRHHVHPDRDMEPAHHPPTTDGTNPGHPVN